MCEEGKFGNMDGNGVGWMPSEFGTVVGSSVREEIDAVGKKRSGEG